MALNDIVFEKTNGGMGRPAANEDVNSGLLMSMDGKISDENLKKFDMISVAGAALYIAKLSYYEQLKMEYDIVSKEVSNETGAALDALYAMNTVDYHVMEFFRMNPNGKLWLAIKLSGEITGDEIKQLQYYAGGSLRQAGVFTGTIGSIDKYQEACTGVAGASSGLEQEHQPLSIIVAPASGVLTLSNLTTTGHKKTGYSNVSILVSCDLSPEIVKRLGDTDFAYYGCIGNCLGAVSKAAVNECIAWVQKFPTGLTAPGFITGELLKEVADYQLNLINDNRYIFVRTHVGTSGAYYNDSFTLDEPTSDYANIENVRTIDKATRGIRANLLPYLNGPLYVNAGDGKLRADTVKFLEVTAGRALEDMEQAGELSGYKAEIDPNQNVLATSELEIQIKQVPVGVMRKVRIKIGFTTKIN